ncbi:ribonucleotide reductase [Synechococcales cyanobacterium C]|uniref:ribonucleoside-diphosphate reductase n=1 Tax=Petrachloros mirabilis ULC683 TaxID=2781853 RepID=A0A8K1ZY62_9CYAN|nr:ribonucleotide reductase [Petrachloros mirabilis ULC683]
MAHTVELLALIEEFSHAFADPEGQREVLPEDPLPTTETTLSLITLAEEFPEAFADPELEMPQESPESVLEPVEAVSASPSQRLAPGYTQALHRQVSTFGWGQVDFYFTYGSTGLESLWMSVGKSGTEAQSLCEAIVRLVNLLLARGVAPVEITREIRGIRGADSEGLGPHKILGLADLIGKVLQEAPMRLVAGEVLLSVAPVAEAPVPEVAPVPETAKDEGWVALSDHEASLCPECGAELQQVNGCSGGACVVCGYSSCS